MFEPFVDENSLIGLSPSASFQKGISDIDAGANIEGGITLPWLSDPQAGYLYYECWIECMLDSGLVVHRHLPQSNPQIPSSLGIDDVNDSAFGKQSLIGVNLLGQESFSDTVQKMAHAIYRFALVGRAIRAGYQVPIPKMKTVGGVPAIPDDAPMQIAYNKPMANFGGIPLFFAEWRLCYTVTVAPTQQQTPVTNLNARIRGDAKLPAELQVPISVKDDNAVTAGPPAVTALNPVRS